MLKIRAKLNEIKTRKKKEKISETKSFFPSFKRKCFILPLVGTWGRASFRQAPKTFSSSLPSWLPFLSRSR